MAELWNENLERLLDLAPDGADSDELSSALKSFLQAWNDGAPDATLDAARTIATGPHAIALHVERVVMILACELGAGKTRTNLNTLASRQAQHCFAEVSLQLVENRLAKLEPGLDFFVFFDSERKDRNHPGLDPSLGFNRSSLPMRRALRQHLDQAEALVFHLELEGFPDRFLGL